MIKARNLRTMDSDELEVRLRELKEELFNLRFQHATGQLDNPMKIKETRRDIARVCTVMTEREYSIHTEAFEEAARLPTLEEPEELLDARIEAEELAEAEEEAEARTGSPLESEEQLEEEVEEELRDI